MSIEEQIKLTVLLAAHFPTATGAQIISKIHAFKKALVKIGQFDVSKDASIELANVLGDVQLWIYIHVAASKVWIDHPTLTDPVYSFEIDTY